MIKFPHVWFYSIIKMTSNAACYGFFAVVVVEILWTRANSRVVQIWFTGQTHGRQRSMFGMLLRVVVSIKQLKWTLWYCVDFNKLLQLYTFISLDFVIHIGWVLFYIGSKTSFFHPFIQFWTIVIFIQNMLFCQPNFPPEETNEMSIAISARTFQNVALFNRLSPVRCAEHKTRCEAKFE